MNAAASSASSSIPPARLATTCGIGLVATIGHFVLCAALAWYFGQAVDVELPEWLRSFDELLAYSISIGAEFAVLLVWWAIVALTAWGLFRAVEPLATMLFGPNGKAATSATWKLLWPTIGLSVFSLFLLPAWTPRHPESETGLETAARSTADEFGYYTVLQLHCLLGLTLMLLVLGLVVHQFDKRWNATVWGFFVGLTLGLGVAGAFCAGLFPLLDRLFAEVGFVATAAIYLTLVAAVTAGPKLLSAARSSSRGSLGQ